MTSQNISKLMSNPKTFSYLEENENILNYATTSIVPFIVNENSQIVYSNLESFLPNPLKTPSKEQYIVEMNQNISEFIHEDTIELMSGLTTLLADVSLTNEDKVEVLNTAMGDFQVELEEAKDATTPIDDIKNTYNKITGSAIPKPGNHIGKNNVGAEEAHKVVSTKTSGTPSDLTTHAADAKSGSPAEHLDIGKTMGKHWSDFKQGATEKYQAAKQSVHDTAQDLHRNASEATSKAMSGLHQHASTLGSHLNPTSNHSYDAMIGGGAGALALGAGALAARHIYKKMKEKKG